MRKNPRTILALDPGLREMGYAILRGRRLAMSGVLELRGLPKDERLAEVRRHVRAWIRTHRPGVIVVERTHHHPVPWLDGLHQLSLYARRLAWRRHLGFVTYSPQRVRQALVGNGRAKKAEVASVISVRFPQLRVYLTQDRKWKVRYWQNMFDAIALALYHQTTTKPPSRSR